MERRFAMAMSACSLPCGSTMSRRDCGYSPRRGRFSRVLEGREGEACRAPVAPARLAAGAAPHLAAGCRRPCHLDQLALSARGEALHLVEPAADRGAVGLPRMRTLLEIRPESFQQGIQGDFTLGAEPERLDARDETLPLATREQGTIRLHQVHHHALRLVVQIVTCGEAVAAVAGPGSAPWAAPSAGAAHGAVGARRVGEKRGELHSPLGKAHHAERNSQGFAVRSQVRKGPVPVACYALVHRDGFNGDSSPLEEHATATLAPAGMPKESSERKTLRSKSLKKCFSHRAGRITAREPQRHSAIPELPHFVVVVAQREK